MIIMLHLIQQIQIHSLGLTQQAIKPTICHIRGNYTNHYTTESVYKHRYMCIKSSSEEIFDHLSDRLAVSAKTGWLRIRIMCTSGATCLYVDYCFSDLTLLKSNSEC
jgi:hypothetical protein